jgi:integrase
MEHRNVLRFYKKMLQKAGLPDMRYHDLHHTDAILMLKEGTNPKGVQECLDMATSA